ncbi:hypothetical protein F0562_031953 [Nyssa sinensis]|uniref:Uncharacterized protein n=1 Tax=Nyssa sinensis TaxID=561372 RepID=A0A5J5AX86_9ASTE|nr:hypothetical protein F0562_031953 [Nyssa sinensis]
MKCHLPSTRCMDFPPVDGFIEVTESMVEMIKYGANEPSVGLFYVQQHTHNAVANLINLNKNNVTEKSQEMALQTQDLEDCITMLRSIKECGFPIADEMIRDIKKSLVIMSTKQPKRGLIRSPSSGFQMGRTSSWGHNAVYTQQDGERTESYLSMVLKSAKQTARNFKWHQLDSKESRQAKDDRFLSYPNRALLAAPASTTSTPLDVEADELPLSSQIVDELQEVLIDEGFSSHQLLSLSKNYDELRADREAKLDDWSGGTGSRDGCMGGTDAEGL